MLKKTARFLFTVRPGTSPTLAYYSGLFGGIYLTIVTARFLAELQEEREWQERWDAAAEQDEPFPTSD